jgi:imidazole glycerol-phosphate synthase subunit HisH
MGTIAVVDYGMGNLHSVAKALERVALRHAVVVTSDPARVMEAERVVFPGQGAMPDCMRELDARGLRAAVVQATHDKPFLGLCIGSQMLFDFSEEGDVAGLGVLPGKVVRFPREGMVDSAGQKLKVPHMGWDNVRQVRAHALWAGIADQERFYFVHSYHAVPTDASVTAGTTRYPYEFTSVVARDNLFACVFHPEKSQAAGLKLLANFIGWNP